MKKIAMMSLALTSTCVLAFAASTDFPATSKSWQKLSQNLRVVNLYNLTDHDLNEIMLGHHPEAAIEFSAQTTLPINFFLKGDLVNLIENGGKFGEVEIKQTFYVRYVGGDLILSINLIDWKPFVEFITGDASVALTIQDGQPSIVFGTETNRRP